MSDSGGCTVSLLDLTDVPLNKDLLERICSDQIVLDTLKILHAVFSDLVLGVKVEKLVPNPAQLLTFLEAFLDSRWALVCLLQERFNP